MQVNVSGFPRGNSRNDGRLSSQQTKSTHAHTSGIGVQLRPSDRREGERLVHRNSGLSAPVVSSASSATSASRLGITDKKVSAR